MSEESVSSIVLGSLSPTSKKSFLQEDTVALSSEVSTVKDKFRKHLGTRLDRIVFGVRKTVTLENQVEKVMSIDENQSNALIKKVTLKISIELPACSSSEVLSC